MRTRLLLACLSLLAVAMSRGRCPAAESPTSMPSRPNILFVFADQWRASATGYAGDPNVHTPNLDKLESASVNFTHAVSGCPVCTPFRASLMTGQRPTTNGMFINDAHLPDDAATLGKALAAAGYDTGYIGKWHLNGRGRLSYIPPENRQGFSYWKAMECTHDYNRSLYFADDNPNRQLWPGYDAAAQAEDARGYVRDHAKKDKPFALFLAWGPPHNPYGTAPEEFRNMYDPARTQLRPNVPQAISEHTRQELAGYYAHCSALDRSLGDLRQTLADAGIENDTILVFTADHGDMLGSHGMERKQKPWDEALRVPMLWHYPAALGAAGKRLDAVINSEDLMPTLLGLCGIAIPKSVEGLDYSAFMRGAAKGPNADNAALISCVAPFGEWGRQNGGREFRGLRTARYTYVRDLKGPWLLYDDEADPYQEKNLVGMPEAADIQAKLDGQLNERLKAAGDEFLPGEKYVEKWKYPVDATGTLPTGP
jgi:arylsulfatase A-like enzyme